MKAHRVLVVDDNPTLVELLLRSLHAEGYQAEGALSGTTALELFPRLTPDLIILDLMMPGVDGFAVLEQVRQRSSVPILVLSAKRATADKTRALNEGTDDYLTKPFEMEELLARVNALLRRASLTMPNRHARAKRFGRLCIDSRKRYVTLDGKRVHLSRTEYALLLEFATHPDEVLRHDTLLRRVWGAAYRQETQYVHAYVWRLRAKIEKDPRKPRYIITEPRVGYRFCTDDRQGEI